LVKELFVFEKLIQNKNLLTRLEIEHSLWYINERILNRFGKDPILLNFNISDIPKVRQEIKIDSILNSIKNDNKRKSFRSSHKDS
jgi:hypothetical protein